MEAFHSAKVFFKNLAAMAAQAWLKACRVLIWPWDRVALHWLMHMWLSGMVRLVHQGLLGLLRALLEGPFISSHALMVLCSPPPLLPRHLSSLGWRKAGVPNLWNLMFNYLRWRWCKGNRNKGHSKCNNTWIMQKPTLYPLVRGKIFSHETCRWCQKGWGPLMYQK